MILPSNNKLSPSLAIPPQLSDHLTPVGTQPHNNNDLTDENSLNNNHPNSRKKRRMLSYMNQTAGQLDLYNPNFSILTQDKKSNENASWLNLPPQKLLPRPYLLINRHNKPYLPIFMYQIHPFSSPTPVFHKLKKLFIKLNKLANNHHNITANSDMLDGIMKGIVFC
ncbi:hypothetical protein O181_067156 [Austropuccinia psidii MF-1]|uniref:Uncharacterized protein n=1 Tax=Austropuccinia psidii MF-1 TaxID=1389203 RepID=A0A9Q3I2T3_9BASI|nr:hypothetical protein [Austropuccinia psidii MF-1]